MIASSSSYTEEYIIHPILMYAASIGKGQSQVSHFIESEVITRVYALATSFFAAADFSLHLGAGLYKYSYQALFPYVKLSAPTFLPEEIEEHFSRAALFAECILIGSVGGFVFPCWLKRYTYTPKMNNRPDTEVLPPFFIELLQRVVTKLVKNPSKKDEVIHELKQVWQRASLMKKHFFVRAFVKALPSQFVREEGMSRESISSAMCTIRNELADIVYKEDSLSSREVRWLSQETINSGVEIPSRTARAANEAFYFHATSKENLKKILASHSVEVRHEKAFRGAFVSTTPEYSFGKYVLAFNRSIERLSPLEHGFYVGDKAFWAGFSQNIPVTEETISYIICESEADKW